MFAVSNEFRSDFFISRYFFGLFLAIMSDNSPFFFRCELLHEPPLIRFLIYHKPPGSPLPLPFPPHKKGNRGVGGLPALLVGKTRRLVTFILMLLGVYAVVTRLAYGYKVLIFLAVISVCAAQRKLGM